MEEREKVIAPFAKTTTTTISVRQLPFLVRKILQECERDGIIEGYLDLSIQYVLFCHDKNKEIILFDYYKIANEFIHT